MQQQQIGGEMVFLYNISSNRRLLKSAMFVKLHNAAEDRSFLKPAGVCVAIFKDCWMAVGAFALNVLYCASMHPASQRGSPAVACLKWLWACGKATVSLRLHSRTSSGLGPAQHQHQFQIGVKVGTWFSYLVLRSTYLKVLPDLVQSGARFVWRSGPWLDQRIC